MSNSFKILFFIASMVFFSCNTSINNSLLKVDNPKTEGSELKMDADEKALMLKGNTLMKTDLYELTINEENKIYDYQSYQITTTTHKETNGHVITIVNVKDQSTFTIGEDWGRYFKGLIDNYMIIDQGTGQMRDLTIYDLSNQKIIFENGYVDELKVVNNQIHFFNQVEIKKEANKPKCPQRLIDIGYGIGYVEKLIYDMDKNKLYRTKKFECKYFE
ncbi:MAG: hypothetical protein CL846_04365 [Crocinitomicaceae bacterium]|nr:hypothetical protein [Crocinitomicaceae bacterium]